MENSDFTFRPSEDKTQVEYRVALPREGRVKRVPIIPRGFAPRNLYFLFYLARIFEFSNSTVTP